MNINPIYLNNEVLKKAFDELPQPYSEINDEFLEKHKKQIDVLKKEFENKGGIHLIKAGDKKVIVRVASATLLDDVIDRSKKMSQSDSMRLLTGSCLLYPSIDVVQNWVDTDSPGFYTPIGTKIADLAKLTVETTAKKL